MPASMPARPAPLWLRFLRYLFLAVVLGTILFGYQVTRLYTDWLWFVEMKQAGVFSTIVWSRVTLFAGFGLLFFLVCYANLWLAQRLNAGKPRPQTREWRFSATTNYRLAGLSDSPWLKRLSVGGSLRWEDKAALGYYGSAPLANGAIVDLDPNRPLARFLGDRFPLFDKRPIRTKPDRVADFPQHRKMAARRFEGPRPIPAFVGQLQSASGGTPGVP